MQKADKMGRPWYGLVPTLVIGGGLAYLNVSYGKSRTPPSPLQQPNRPQDLTPPTRRRRSLRLVLQPNLPPHPLRLGHDLPLEHPNAARMETARPLSGRTPLEKLDMAVGCLLGSILVHHPNYSRVLPGGVAPWGRAFSGALFLRVLFGYCCFGVVCGCEGLL